jgi:hydroxyacylglutathione hydrolase
MAGLKLETIVTGAIANNCYIVYSDETKKSFLIDCTSPVLPIKEFLQKNKLTLDFIALTHGHFDHIDGLSEFDVPFYIHSQDQPFLKEGKFNGSVFFCSDIITVAREPFLYEKSQLSFEGHPLEIIHTPGHTPGSVCIRLDNWLFSGDTLFNRSVGRTDAPLGSERDILNSIHKKLLVLPDKILVYPGHGFSTTIGEERAENPFLI